MKAALPKEKKLIELLREIRQEAQNIRNIKPEIGLPKGLKSLGEFSVIIGGTPGLEVELSTTAQVTRTLRGNPEGLGQLSETRGTIPFTVTFRPNGNYGVLSISAASVDNPEATTEKQVRIVGQTQEEALALEEQRHDAVASFLNALGVLLGIVAGVCGIIVFFIVSTAAVITISAVAIGAIAIAALGYAAVTVLEALEIENEVHRENMSVIETLPK